jgi:predicted nucleic acid-binding protein
LLYLDSNVFVHATINRKDTGDRARLLLGEIQDGKTQASSSALTFDELVWVVKKYRNIEDAIDAGRAFMNMPGLKLVTVNEDLLVSALDLIKRYKLDPRDSIHAASTLSEKAEYIVSTDEHFDRVKEIRRRPI